MSDYPMARACAAETHQVDNMPPVLENYNLFSSDVALQQIVAKEGDTLRREDLLRLMAPPLAGG